MDIEGSYRIGAPRDAVWAALIDPEVLQRCIPGCETMEQVSDDEFDATVRGAVGPVRARFATRITLENLDPPDHYTLVGEAKAGAAGFGRGTAKVRLEDDGAATLLHYGAHFSVGGKLAQIGSRLVVSAVRKTADDFFGAFSKELDEQATRLHPEPPPAVTPAGARTAVIAAAALAAALLIWWFLIR